MYSKRFFLERIQVKKKILVNWYCCITEVTDTDFTFEATETPSKYDADKILICTMDKGQVREFDQKHIREGSTFNWIIYQRPRKYLKFLKKASFIIKFRKVRPFTKEEIEQAKKEAENILVSVFDMKPITKEMIDAVKEFLGTEGIEHFREYKKKYYTVSPVIPGSIPHPVHFREGMQIRNILRTKRVCKDWETDDYDNNWARVVEEAIK